MEQLLDFLEHDRFPEAALRTRELTSALSELPYRRGPYISEQRKNELLNAREQVNLIGEVISKSRGQPLSAEQKEKLVRECRQTLMTLRKNLGTIKAHIDSGATQ